MAGAKLQQVLVVAGVVLYGEQVLISQRPPGGPHGLLWEFPGGKVEPGEHPADALVRELDEELALAVTDLELFSVESHVDVEAKRHIVLLVYLARPAGPGPRPRQGQRVALAVPEELAAYALAPPDRAVAGRLAARLRGSPPARP